MEYFAWRRLPQWIKASSYLGNFHCTPFDNRPIDRQADRHGAEHIVLGDDRGVPPQNRVDEVRDEVALVNARISRGDLLWRHVRVPAAPHKAGIASVLERR